MSVRPTASVKQVPSRTLSLRMLSHHRLPRMEAEATGIGGPLEVRCVGCCAGNSCDSGEPVRSASLNSSRGMHFEGSRHPSPEQGAKSRRFALLTPRL